MRGDGERTPAMTLIHVLPGVELRTSRLRVRHFLHCATSQSPGVSLLGSDFWWCQVLSKLGTPEPLSHWCRSDAETSRISPQPKQYFTWMLRLWKQTEFAEADIWCPLGVGACMFLGRCGLSRGDRYHRKSLDHLFACSVHQVNMLFFMDRTWNRDFNFNLIFH